MYLSQFCKHRAHCWHSQYFAYFNQYCLYQFPNSEYAVSFQIMESYGMPVLTIISLSRFPSFKSSFHKEMQIGFIHICNFHRLKHWNTETLACCRAKYMFDNQCPPQGVNRMMKQYTAPKRLFRYLHHILSSIQRAMACLSLIWPSLSRLPWYLTVIFLTQNCKYKFLGMIQS